MKAFQNAFPFFFFVASRKYQGEILDPNSDAQTFQEAPDAESKS